MKGSTIFTVIAATAFMFAAASASAQSQQAGGQQGGRQQGSGQQGSGQQQMQQQQQRQAERAMSQDRVMDQTRLQSRERTQDHEQPQAQAGAQTRASQGQGEGIYGGNLMTVQERNQYRAELGAQKTDTERLEYQARHREKMAVRAKERGIEPQITDD